MKAILFASLALCIVPLASARQDEEVFFLGDGDFDLSSVMMQAPTPGAPGAQPAGPPSPRLQKLQALEYDRRPSSILAEWAKPPAPPAEVPPATGEAEGESEAARPSEAAPAVASSDESTPIETPGETAAEGAGEETAASAEPAEGAAADPPDEAAANAAAQAAEAAKKAAEEAAKQAAEAKAIEAEMTALKRSVTLGEWGAVRDYLAGLTEDEAKGGYTKMLQSLVKGVQQRPNVPPQGTQYVEKNRFSPDDVLGLAECARGGPSKEDLAQLGAILVQALAQGHQLEDFLADLAPRFDEEGFALGRRNLALLLVAAERPLALEGLVPPVDEALAADDREGLNLISRYCLARYAKDKRVDELEDAWRATRGVLAAGEVDEKEKAQALERAVEIAPKIRAELGQAWLDESFTEHPERGKDVLAAIGSAASTRLAAQPMDADGRQRLLELQTTAARALLAAAPERAEEWSDELSILAENWLREALVTYQLDDATSRSPRMQRDPWGNFYYYDGSFRQGGSAPKPIPTSKVLDLRPGDPWLAHVHDTLRPRCTMLFAQLLLKVSAEAEAFPYIEQVAATHPKQAKELVDEFLRVWAKNHDPNSEQDRIGSYMYFYGFEERASGIPLTRSKQERNLAELEQWVARLRELPVEIDDDLLTRAFEQAHSSAEIYRLETIERVFGPMDGLEPSTLAALVQQMRTNLVDVWRDPALQDKKKTNRHKKDIEAEVLRGYELANATLDRALAEHADSWELRLARASLAHDENNYQHELQPESDFSARRAEALADFHEAARLYAERVESLEQEKESTRVYELWFYAALGACDLNRIRPEMRLAPDEIPLIKAAILALPGERAQRHLGMFASQLFARMSNVNPGVKFRYVREGLAITGDHELARDAKDVFDYYSDLVTEIQLVAHVDGTDRVGHGEPFGLTVDIRHTREIERESGGFGKYLQNQNAQNYSYNYGRPTEDYRDKFETAAREALGEAFEVLSVTFNEPTAGSRADAEYGWRVTPYAYLLLKPRGAQVDKVPSLHLDLDFLDTSGYAVLPIETSPLPIDAREAKGDERPYSELELTQNLNERFAKDGKLVLEVKARAKGLVPELDRLLDLHPAGFDVADTVDQGVSVAQFAEEGEGVVSERSWTVSLKAEEGAPPPAQFAFATPRVEGAKNELFRYVDADLVGAEPVVDLERAYGKPSRAWIGWIAGLAALAVAARFAWKRWRPEPRVEAARFRLPEPLTPFTVLGLLRDIERNDGLAPDGKRALADEIRTIERHYFDEEAGSAPDLRGIAERWLTRAS